MARKPSQSIRCASPDELYALANHFVRDGKPETADRLEEAADLSVQIWTALDDEGQYLALWGVAPAEQTSVGQPSVGQIWMLILSNMPRQALVQAMGMVVAEMLGAFDVVENVVDQSRSWALEIFGDLGFEIGPPDPLTGRQRVWLEDSSRLSRTGVVKN